MNNKAKVLLFFMTIFIFSQKISAQRSEWLMGVAFKLETRKEETKLEIQKMQNGIQKCESNISKSQAIIILAQQKGNIEAEKIAHNALKLSQDTKKKNIVNLNAITHYFNNLNSMLEYVKTGANDVEVKLEQFKFENERSEWMKMKDEEILKRLSIPDSYCENLNKSIKTNAPPPLSRGDFKDLKIGDVMLVHKDTFNIKFDLYEDYLNIKSTILSNAINIGDNILSFKKTNVSHTLIYLKEINGKKMFLDNVPGKGPTIISEQEYIYLYGKRGAEVAEIARPLSKEQGEKLYTEARLMADKQLQNKSLVGTTYGVMGTDMVCSEASRWALVKTGAQIPETDDKLKRLKVLGYGLGLEWSPADFCKSDYFTVTPLSGLPKK